MKKTLEQKMAEVGGREWTAGDKHRIYFNDLKNLYGLDIVYYNTGNISGASLDGERISNSRARKICTPLNFAKLFYDVNEKKFSSKNLDAAMERKMINALELKIAAA